MPSAPAVIYAPPTPAPATPAVIGVAAAAAAAPPVFSATPSASPVTPPAIAVAAAAPAAPPAVFVPQSVAAQRAFLTAGNITWTSTLCSSLGNATSMTITTPAGSALVVTYNGQAISVAAGITYRASISSALTDGNGHLIVFPDLAYVSQIFGWSSVGIKNPIVDQGYFLFGQSEAWHLIYRSSSATYEWDSDAAVDSPNLVPAGDWDAITNAHAWKPGTSNTGAPVVTLAAATKAQVIDAVAASAIASALLAGTAAGDVTGTVATLATTYLSGGIGPAAPAAI